MKKSASIVYVAVCLFLCTLPFAGMLVARTDVTTENRTLAEFPQIQEEGKWNIDYLQEAGDYFEDHFAFRSLLVTMDSVIQSKIFGVSNMDTVLAGKDGWLYYTATLNDYLGTDTLSERGVYNMVHNISLLQQYVEERGAKFLLTIPPNKNSLYGENMPYYAGDKVSDVNNITLLKPELEKYEISYEDLFTVFSESNETLYLRQDSHWNHKGAVLAYNTILNRLSLEHETYETIENVRTKTTYGDLNKMLYPLDFAPEWDYSYKKEMTYRYVTETESVEDAWIETENADGEGSLLMFRDSFGNTLLPLMADTFQTGYFTKSQPYAIESYIERYHPEYVIVEKVERNIVDFAKEPPIMTGPVVTIEAQAEAVETSTEIVMAESEYDTAYWEIKGQIDSAYMKPDMKIYVHMEVGETITDYEAFTVTTSDSDNGYLLYIPKKQLMEEDIRLEILTESDGKLQSVATKQFQRSELVISNGNEE